MKKKKEVDLKIKKSILLDKASKIIIKVRNFFCKRNLPLLRDISLTIILVLNIFPSISNRLVFGFFAICWVIISAVIERKYFISFFIKPNLLMYSIYGWLAFYLLMWIIGRGELLPQFLINYIRIGFSSIIFIYYIKNKQFKSLKIFSVTSIICIFLVNMITVIFLAQYGNLSRMLSTGIDFGYDTIGVASYSYIYGLIYIIFVLLGILIYSKKKNEIEYKKKKILTFLLLILCGYTLYRAEFFISFILICFGIVMIVFKIDNIKKVAIVLIGGISLLLISAQPLSSLFRQLANNTNSPNLKMRYTDIANFISTGDIENTIDLKKRAEVYIFSIKAFQENPIIGVGFNNLEETGDHSTFLDEFAKYGFIGAIPLLFMIYTLYSTTYKLFTNMYQKRIFFTSMIVFSIFMIINNILFVAIFSMLFVIAPSLIYLLLDDENVITNEKKGNKYESNVDC